MPHHNHKHGYSQTKIYDVWRQMHQRCYNRASKDYPMWGGRGITVCAEWHDIAAFVAWAAESGYRDKVTIERRDNNADYSPDNCHWVDNRLQAKNTRRQRMIEVDGVQMDMQDAARLKGMNYSTLRMRMNLGWTGERLFSPAVRGRNQAGLPRALR